MVSFENFVKSMTPSLLELKVTPSFCFTFKIPDDVTATIIYTVPTTLLSRRPFFFLTRPENDLSAKKDNTNGNRILTNDKKFWCKACSFFQNIHIVSPNYSKFFYSKKIVLWFDGMVWRYDENHRLRTPNKAFFHWNPELLGLGRQIWQINSETLIGVF